MLVWYAAYGSNLLHARFETYLRGGPVPGSGRLQAGARDPAGPQDSRPFEIANPLIFARRSRSWRGGGVCFLDPTVKAPISVPLGLPGALRTPVSASIAGSPFASPPVGATAGRVWLVTSEQFSDVWAQENGLEVGVDLDIERLVTLGSMDVGTRWYSRLLLLGQLDGRPVVTFTCTAATDLNPGDGSYLHVVGRGLMETWQWSAEEAAAYLARCAGNLGMVEPASLTSLLGSEPMA